MSRLPALALILSIVLLAAPAARASDEEPPPEESPPPAAAPLPARPGAPAALAGDEVLVSAELLERDNEERVVTGEGAVMIRHRELRLVADRVVYHERTREVIADGNVVLDSGDDRLQGEHLELNLDTRIGFLEQAQGFVQTYYFTGERIEKRGPDHYFLRGGSFTTCEGTLPDWSFHATSTDITIDEYLHAWNPTLRLKRLPVLYFPYAIFPVKRDRSTGLLIPSLSVKGSDGFTVRNSFYWAPRDNFDATLGIDYLQRTGWGASGQMRYLLAARTQGVLEAYYLHNTRTEAQRWSLSTRNSQDLPLGIHAEAEAFIQSDRTFSSTQGTTIEARSSERTTSSFYLNRSWSAWDFALSGRHEQSLLTASRSTLTRFPELTIDRTSTRLFDSELFLKLSASGVRLARDGTSSSIATTRLHLAPELTWPISLGTVARVKPAAGYDLTHYSQDTEGNAEARGLPYYRIGLEGPRPYRVWDLQEGGRIEKLKHLIEPRITYVFTPAVEQGNIPQFDSLDRVTRANRLEYSLTNTLYAKVRSEKTSAGASAAAGAAVAAAGGAEAAVTTATAPAAAEGAVPEGAAPTPGAAAGTGVAPARGDPPAVGAAAPRYSTQEVLWLKFSQRYTFDEESRAVAGEPFSAVEWEARSRPMSGLEMWWRGNFDVYGDGIGYQNVSLTWKPSAIASLRAEWRTARDSNQDFLDLGGTLSLGRIGLEGRSRYNLAEDTFVENRASVKYTSQCWDITLGYVRWTDEYEYSLLLSLKGIGTVVKI